MVKGWFRHPKEHSKAAKGIKTAERREKIVEKLISRHQNIANRQQRINERIARKRQRIASKRHGARKTSHNPLGLTYDEYYNAVVVPTSQGRDMRWAVAGKDGIHEIFDNQRDARQAINLMTPEEKEHFQPFFYPVEDTSLLYMGDLGKAAPTIAKDMKKAGFETPPGYETETASEPKELGNLRIAEFIARDEQTAIDAFNKQYPHRYRTDVQNLEIIDNKNGTFTFLWEKAKKPTTPKIPSSDKAVEKAIQKLIDFEDAKAVKENVEREMVHPHHAKAARKAVKSKSDVTKNLQEIVIKRQAELKPTATAKPKPAVKTKPRAKPKPIQLDRGNLRIETKEGVTEVLSPNNYLIIEN